MELKCRILKKKILLAEILEMNPYYYVTLFRKCSSVCMFLKRFWQTRVLFWGHWYPCFGFLVSLLWISMPKRVLPYSLFCGGKCNIHSMRSTSGATGANLLAAQLVTSHMLQQRWDLAWIQTGNHPNRRRMHYHCASDPGVCVCFLKPFTPSTIAFQASTLSIQISNEIFRCKYLLPEVKLPYVGYKC